MISFSGLVFFGQSDLFPEEDMWLWTSGMPLLTARRMLAVGTLLGPQKERHVNWYLESVYLEKLVGQLAPHLDTIAEIIQHYAISVCTFCLCLYLMFSMEWALLVGLI